MAKASATAADASAADETTTTTATTTTEATATSADPTVTTSAMDSGTTTTTVTEKIVQLGKCAIKYQGEYRTGQLTLPVAIADKLIADGFAKEVV